MAVFIHLMIWNLLCKKPVCEPLCTKFDIFDQLELIFFIGIISININSNFDQRRNIIESFIRLSLFSYKLPMI